MTRLFVWLGQRKGIFLRTVVTALASIAIGISIYVIRCIIDLQSMDGDISISGVVNRILPLDGDGFLLLLRSSWPFALGTFLLLTLLEIWVGRALHSPRLVTRLIFWELLAAVLLLGAVTGCMAVIWGSVDSSEIRISFFQLLFFILTACLLIFLVLFWITRRLLAPLDTIRSAMEECYICGGGNTVPLSDMPHTELYEMGRVFNQLSIQTRTQLNDLQAVNAAYQRLVPNSLLQILDQSDVSALRAGDMVTQHASLLVLALQNSEEQVETAVRTIHQAAESIGVFGGMVVNHDVGLKALIVLFPSQKQALSCARAVLDRDLPVMAVLLREQVMLGLFGGEHLLLPLALAPHMARRLALISLLRQFGARVICCHGDLPHLRLLGWDDGLPFYEEIRWRGNAWLSLWQEARPLWEQAMELYRQGRFGPAMRRLASVLSILPHDQAARWYLFRCEALRDGKEKTPNLDLLSHWEARA